MSAELAAATAGGSGRARRPRFARYIAGVVVGALLLWGPVGIGNGPLSTGVWDTQSWSEPDVSPIGTIIPVNNSGRAPAVIDAVQLIGNTRYRAAAPQHPSSWEVFQSAVRGRSMGHGTAHQGLVRGYLARVRSVRAMITAGASSMAVQSLLSEQQQGYVHVVSAGAHRAEVTQDMHQPPRFRRPRTHSPLPRSQPLD